MAAALASAGMVTGSNASADPVKVGIIDTSVDRIILDSQDVSIERRSFLPEGQKPGSWKAYMGMEHGSVVASSFVEQSKKIDQKAPISIYSAGAFYIDEGAQRGSEGQKPMRINFKAAERALDWFHDNGVRTVVTAFYTADDPQMRSFIEKARKLDMVLFAGTNNDKARILPFPARDPYAIAVTGTNSNLDFENNVAMRGWTAFKTTGDVPSNDMEPTPENGSSFAVARAAAFGAHYVRAHPETGRDGVVDAMERAAQKNPTGVMDLNGKKVVTRFRMVLADPLAKDSVRMAGPGPDLPASAPSERRLAHVASTLPGMSR